MHRHYLEERLRMNRLVFDIPAGLLRRHCCALLGTLLALTLAACGGGESANGPTPAAAPTVLLAPAPAATPAPASVSATSTPASSAGPGVLVYPTRLAMPGLDRTRGLRIYLPPGYASSHKRYPVIYMHDAQNLFDDATAQAGEWRVDESMDELAREGALEAIVVGIDRGGEIGKLWEDELRGRELMPFDDFGLAQAKQYMNFIVNVVKPLIDREFRTLRGRDNTAIAGASLGGLISYFGINEYPQVFGRAIMFSSSFPWSFSSISYEFAHKVPPKDSRLYFLVGGAEHPLMIDTTKDVAARQLEKGHQPQDLALTVVPCGEHGEAMYRQQFKAAAKWLFAKPVALDPPPARIASTAGPNVITHPSRLAIPGTDRTRGIRIYLPPGYAKSKKNYPVIYMQDGQNLFDDATAQAGKGGEWQVDETMDELARSGQLEAIVVGVDRAGEPGHLAEDMLREREFIPFQLKTSLLEYKSESTAYVDFVVKVVKPLVDRQYRTLPDQANTAVLGAGLGGMISYYIANEYPTTFSKLGLLSPILDVGTLNGIEYYLGKLPPTDTRIYFMTGVNDYGDTRFLSDIFSSELIRLGHRADAIQLHANAGPEVREALWRKQFKHGVLWLFNNTTPPVPAP